MLLFNGIVCKKIPASSTHLLIFNLKTALTPNYALFFFHPAALPPTRIDMILFQPLPENGHILSLLRTFFELPVIGIPIIT